MKCHLIVLLLAALAAATSARVVKRESAPCDQICKDTPLDISFIVDSSASIWPGNYTLGLWFVADFLERFTIGPDAVMVSMVTFGSEVYDYDAFHFTSFTDKPSLKQAIVSMPYRHGASTETGAAIRWFMEHQYPENRDGVDHILIVLTDGNSQETEITKSEAEKALAAGLEIFAIGVGNTVSYEELLNIATDAQHVYDVAAYNVLGDIVTGLVQVVCGSPAEPPKPEPYVVDCHYAPVDIAFVLDSSRSIESENFTIELQFIKEFLQDFDIQPSAARVAAIMFGNRVYDEKVINFDQFPTKNATLEAMLSLPFMSGTSTQTGKGIDYMVDNFLPQFRPSVPHVGIVITDGNSQEGAKTATAAERAREHGITMVAVGVGEDISQDELKAIAGDEDRVLRATNFRHLESIRQTLISVTCANIERLRAQRTGQGL